MRLLTLLCAAAMPFDALLAESPKALFDAHVHLWNGRSSLDSYSNQSRESGLNVGGAAIMWFGGANQGLMGRPEDMLQNNDAVIWLAQTAPNLLPIATVHPYDGKAAIAELESVAARGVKLLKIHPHTQRFNVTDPRVLALVRRAGELNVAVLIDNASILPGDNQNLFNLALGAPSTTFTFAHMGATEFRFWNTLKLARTAEGLFANNIYFDISGIVTLVADSPIEEEFVWTMRNVGLDHILLGSDYPQFTLTQLLQALERLNLTSEEKQKIRFENAKRLFRLVMKDKIDNRVQSISK